MPSMFNKTKTVSCPRSWSEYLEAASKLCPIVGDEFNYICIPNANKTELVQFCFERRKFPAWQLGNHCPYLHHTGNMNSENCTRFSYGCPVKHYETRELYKFPVCTQINQQSGCYSADPKCPPIRLADATITQEENITATRNNNNKFKLSVAFIAPILFIVVVGMVLWRCRFYRKEQPKDAYELVSIQNDEAGVSLKDNKEKDEKISTQSNSGGKDVIDKNINTFFEACRYGKLSTCQHIIKQYPDMITEKDVKGCNGASYAAEGGNVEVLELLVKNGIEVRNKNNSGSNILHIACLNCKLEMCQHIIKQYPDVIPEKDVKGWNAASYAAEGGNVEVLELLAKNGVDLTQTNYYGSNIFHIACRNSQLEMCQHIINHYSSMIHEVDRRGWNAASNAAEGGKIDILKLLERNGVNIFHENRSGVNILNIACFNSKIAMCQHIMNHYPVMLNHLDAKGYNAAGYAAQGGHIEVLEILAKYGVDIRHENNSKSNILHIACYNSTLDMCQYIIKHYPDMLNQVNNEGENEAIQAAQGGNVDVLKLLDKNGVDVRRKNNSGNNILHIACLKSRLEMCQHIIKHYPDIINDVDNNGWNAAFSTAQGGCITILELLAENGVNLSHKSKCGSNILHIACENSHLQMCKYIKKHYPNMLNEANNNGCIPTFNISAQ